MSFDLRMMESYLQRSIEEFDSNPLATRLMRRLASEAPDTFFPVAMTHLNSKVESNAYRLLTILLLRQDDLLERLASPAYNTRDSAVTLFKRFLAVDPSFDVKMARRLPARSYVNHASAFDGVHTSRALDILDQTSRGRRLLPILGHLPESNDNRVSAKATLFVGRRVQNPSWTRKQLARPDPRIRANAVEALWGVQTAPALRLLEDCVTDQNHRVAGNSLVGLHIAGREDAKRETMMMSRLGKAEARSTAAWVMGKIATPDFTRRLTELIRDEQPQVRSTALRALMDVRRLESNVPQSVSAKAAEQSEQVTIAAIVNAEESVHADAMRPLHGTTYIVRR